MGVDRPYNYILYSLKLTLPKPLKIGLLPKGNDRIPTIHFQVQAVSFREDITYEYTCQTSPNFAFLYLSFWANPPSKTCRNTSAFTRHYLGIIPLSKWLGSPPFISHKKAMNGRGPTLPPILKGDVGTTIHPWDF